MRYESLLTKQVEKKKKKDRYRNIHVSIITKNGNILAVGNNKFGQNKLVQLFTKHSFSIHSEIDAISKIDRKNRKKKLKNAIIYNMCVSRSSLEVKLAKPCVDCQKIIRYFRMKCQYSFPISNQEWIWKSLKEER